MSKHEILDIVSCDDQVIGSMSREAIYEKNLNSFRVINAFIINSQGKLWIPTRHPLKKLFPLCLDCSIGGHVKSGESYDQAFVREAQEETGLDPRTIPHKHIGSLTPHQHKTSAYMHVYALYWDGEIAFNKNDFIDSRWTTARELKKLLQSGTHSKSDLPIILNTCFPDE